MGQYILIPIIVFATLWVSSYFSSAGLSWYHDLQLPPLTPPSWVFPVAWNSIGVLISISLIAYFKSRRVDNYAWLIMGLYIFNGLCVVVWTYNFFTLHTLGRALGIAILLELDVLLLIALLSPRSKIASLTLVPYALWLFCAIYFNYGIWALAQ